jgi:hypothetical protein
MANEKNPNSFASLLTDVVNDIRDLFRQEVNLARVEIKQEMSNAKSAAIKIGGAVFALLLATLFLLTALARGLSDLFHMPVWAGYAIVGVLLGIVGGVMMVAARANVQKVGPIPARTVRTMKENVEWVKRETS